MKSFRLARYKWSRSSTGTDVSNSEHSDACEEIADSYPQRISEILVCRFFLDIRQFSSHPNDSSQTRTSLSVTSFQAATGRIKDPISEEFGDRYFDETFSVSQDRGDVSAMERHPVPQEQPIGAADGGDTNRQSSHDWNSG